MKEVMVVAVHIVPFKIHLFLYNSFIVILKQRSDYNYFVCSILIVRYVIFVYRFMCTHVLLYIACK